MSDNQNSTKNLEIKSSKKGVILRVGKVTYGDIPIKEAFTKALAPYFDPGQVEYMRKRHD